MDLRHERVNAEKWHMYSQEDPLDSLFSSTYFISRGSKALDFMTTVTIM